MVKEESALDRFLGKAMWVFLALLVVLLAYWFLAANNLLPDKEALTQTAPIIALLLALFVFNGFFVGVLVGAVLTLAIIFFWKKIGEKE